MDDILSGGSELSQDDKRTIKALGIEWNTTNDSFSYKVTTNSRLTYTKRKVLSDIARIYDPLDLIGPVITRDKIFMQSLWLINIDWHEHLSEPSAKQWTHFVSTLTVIEKLRIPRRAVKPNTTVVLHGFADACETAFGAVLYLQSRSSEQCSTELLYSKSRVSSLKKISVPRLEVCARLLLAQLVKKALSALKLDISEVFLWSDSMIALACIATSPHSLKTFVRNRVTKIQNLTENYIWRHVFSKDNPSEFICGGLNPEK
ncbi:uncharacterized protein LOC118194903 [Stegodyphus dumicola]|uniref:uncharacterized protein LOC118194903 n=1 Tax=Stegodyphus dumicola TaxID=202533 RepID=UPI0015AFA56A|nr:uncharacterized protein LOC118194903 [Stegodyphus dumicola]